VIVGFEQDTADKDLVIRNLDSKIVMQQWGAKLATLNRT
jgi:hypothetical protein